MVLVNLHKVRSISSKKLLKRNLLRSECDFVLYDSLNEKDNNATCYER